MHNIKRHSDRDRQAPDTQRWAEQLPARGRDLGGGPRAPHSIVAAGLKSLIYEKRGEEKEAEEKVGQGPAKKPRYYAAENRPAWVKGSVAEAVRRGGGGPSRPPFKQPSGWRGSYQQRGSRVGCPRNSVDTEFRLFFLLPSIPYSVRNWLKFRRNSPEFHVIYSVKFRGISRNSVTFFMYGIPCISKKTFLIFFLQSRTTILRKFPKNVLRMPLNPPRAHYFKVLY